MSETYAGKALAVTHKGAYKDSGPAYCLLEKYAKENSIETADICYEFYLNNPEEVPEAELLTQITFPIK
jgi:effector-binding domain-containing protein